MIKRFNRKIKSQVVRKMLHWSHYSFRQRLHYHFEKEGGRVHDVSEHYTSKSCGNCGSINWNLGGNEWFYCEHCQFSPKRL